jgi:hypothetical protein
LKDGSKLKAHAWVELANYVVNDQRTATRVFTPLSQVPVATSASHAMQHDIRSAEWQ